MMAKLKRTVDLGCTMLRRREEQHVAQTGWRTNIGAQTKQTRTEMGTERRLKEEVIYYNNTHSKKR